MNLRVTLSYEKVGDIDADDYGDPQFTLYQKVEDWADFHDIELDYWFDDLSNIWFEFENRVQAMLFMLEYGGECPQ